MGYFDALTSMNFKKSKTGHWLFFPWGPLGPGYIIYAEQLYHKLHREIKLFFIISILGLIILNLFLKIIFAVAVSITYIIWTNKLCRRMFPTDEELSLRENFNTQALSQSSIDLWLLTICSMVFVAASLYIFFNDLDRWLTAVLGLIFFGFAAGFFIKSIITRKKLREEMRSSDDNHKNILDKNGRL